MYARNNTNHSYPLILCCFLPNLPFRQFSKVLACWIYWNLKLLLNQIQSHTIFWLIIFGGCPNCEQRAFDYWPLIRYKQIRKLLWMNFCFRKCFPNKIWTINSFAQQFPVFPNNSLHFGQIQITKRDCFEL